MLIIGLLFALLVASTQVHAAEKVDAAGVTTVLNQLVTLDTNGGGPADVVTSMQNQASGKICSVDHDSSKLPLFTSVSDRITTGATFKSFETLQALYTIADVTQDDPNTPERTAAINAFLDEVLKTKVMSAAMNFLTKAGLTTDLVAFKQQLFDLWFETFARKTAKGSSGFETVFVGEVDATDIVGFNNWYRFYLLEKAGAVNYHGYFAPKDKLGVNMLLQFTWGDNCYLKDGILLGTSPEFDMAAYTICALTKLGECSYVNNGVDLVLAVSTKVDGTATRIESVFPSNSGEPPVDPSGAPSTCPLSKMQELVNAMYDVDEDKPTNYKLDFGTKVTTGKEQSPLFVSEDETLFKKDQYAALIALYDAANCTAGTMSSCVFQPEVCNAEKPISGFKKAYLKNVYDVFTSTPMFNLTLKYLQECGVATDWATFSPKLWTLWFGMYSRCGGALGSSGFEHVFLGEWKENKVDGHHSWVRYYLQQKAQQIKYYGYYIHHEQLSGTMQYSWGDHIKQKGGFDIGTSPAFDFCMLSACALTHGEGGGKCKFTIAGYRMSVTSYTQACGEGKCLSTAYPVVET